MIQDHEIDAYLDNAEVTDEQRQQIRTAWEAIAARYADADPQDPDAVTTAPAAAVQVILGDATLEALGQAYTVARAAEREAMAALTGGIAAAAAQGMTERALAEHAGVTRVTVRKALGKGSTSRFAEEER